jgi:hypothetical protein
MGNILTQEQKFLVDLQDHIYISSKAHQIIIDEHHLDPAGYDNYAKGWITAEPKIKVWVEQFEDLVFRYWDQLRVAFRHLLRKKLVTSNCKLYAIVNHTDCLAGTIHNFLHPKDSASWIARYGTKSLALNLSQAPFPKDTSFKTLFTIRLKKNLYLSKNTTGKLLISTPRFHRKLKIRFEKSMTGLYQKKPAVIATLDRRVLLPF